MIESPQAAELAARIARGRAAIAEAKAEGRQVPDWEAHLLGLERALAEELRAVAFYRADRINDMLGIDDDLVRGINRWSWWILDCEDAAVPEAVIEPLRAEKRRLGEMFERRRKRQKEAAA